MQKWAFIMIFVWILGTWLGAVYEQDWTVSASAFGSSGNSSSMEKMLSISTTDVQGTAGTNILLTPTRGKEFFTAWFEVLTWDFPFFKPIDTNGDGSISVVEEGNNDFGKYIGILVRGFATIGLLVFVIEFFQLLQGIWPF